MSGPLASLKVLSHSSALRPLSQQYPTSPEEWGCPQVLAPAHKKPEFA